MLDEDLTLPALRSDIQLNEAPAEPDGSPSWTLYDPAANKYYKIGWLEFECLSRFQGVESVNQLVQKVRAETTLLPDGEMVNGLVHFLITHNLVYATANESLDHFQSQREKTKRPWWSKLLHSYLFFTLPLFRPETFLKKTYPIISPLFTRPFMIGVFLLLGYGIILSIQRFDEIASTFVNYLTIEGVVLFVGATIVVKIIHELGHAYTATRYNVPVTTIGLAFIVLYPILYTETTNAWKLKNRHNRLVIAAGGMMAELALASVTLILWHILPPGIGQSLCFMIAIVSMLASLLVNLNPLMKFDGYYLFSDLVGVDNLQDRSFAFFKWKIRRFLWGWDDLPPEITDAHNQRFFVGFAILICIYRFFLYLGIAILVYHLFFQPLGLILMIIELAFFIGLPILREVKVWLGRFPDIVHSLRGKITLFLLFLITLIAFIPIPNSIEIPVMLHAKNYVKLYSPIPAKIDRLMITEGQRVEKGDILFQLSSYDLDHNINITTQRLNDLKAIRNSSQAIAELANKRSMINSDIENTLQQLEGYEEIRNKLTIKAPFAGTVKIMDASLKEGQWINTRALLALITDNDKKTLSGYIRERDIDKIANKDSAKFYAEYSPFTTYDVRLDQLEKTRVNTLFWPELSSLHGGPIPSETTQEGNIRPLPRYTYYPVRFEINKHNDDNPFPEFTARGTVVMFGKDQILAKSLIKKGTSVLVMDSGF